MKNILHIVFTSFFWSHFFLEVEWMNNVQYLSYFYSKRDFMLTKIDVFSHVMSILRSKKSVFLEMWVLRALAISRWKWRGNLLQESYNYCHLFLGFILLSPSMDDTSAHFKAMCIAIQDYTRKVSRSDIRHWMLQSHTKTIVILYSSLYCHQNPGL